MACTFFEVVEFEVKTCEICEVGSGSLDEDGGVIVGLGVCGAGGGCFLVELLGNVDDHSRVK
jgi:hypothetical protein